MIDYALDPLCPSPPVVSSSNLEQAGLQDQVWILERNWSAITCNPEAFEANGRVGPQRSPSVQRCF